MASAAFCRVRFSVDPARSRNQLAGGRFLSRRAELLDTSKILETAALDPYEFLRDAYLQRRRNLVHDGNPPPDKDEDLDIKAKPRTERPKESAPPWADAEPPVNSVLVSDIDETTPARQEAEQRAGFVPNPGSEPDTVTPSGQPRVVRVWATTPSH